MSPKTCSKMQILAKKWFMAAAVLIDFSTFSPRIFLSTVVTSTTHVSAHTPFQAFCVSFVNTCNKPFFWWKSRLWCWTFINVANVVNVVTSFSSPWQTNLQKTIQYDRLEEAHIVLPSEYGSWRNGPPPIGLKAKVRTRESIYRISIFKRDDGSWERFKSVDDWLLRAYRVLRFVLSLCQMKPNPISYPPSRQSDYPDPKERDTKS